MVLIFGKHQKNTKTKQFFEGLCALKVAADLKSNSQRNMIFANFCTAKNLIIKIDDLVGLWTKLLLPFTLAVHLVQNYMSSMMMKTFCTGVCQKIKSDSLKKTCFTMWQFHKWFWFLANIKTKQKTLWRAACFEGSVGFEIQFTKKYDFFKFLHCKKSDHQNWWLGRVVN